MNNRMKTELERSTATRLKLNDDRKQKIVRAAHRRLDAKPSRRRRLAPPLVAVAVVGMMLFLFFPQIQSILENGTVQDDLAEQGIQKAVIPGVEYANLINAVYVDVGNELIYTDGNDIFSFSLESQQAVRIIEGTGGHIAGVTLDANEKWLLWESDGVLYVLNRETEDVQTIEDYFGMGMLAGDVVLYGSPDETFSIHKLSLTTGNKTVLHTYAGQTDIYGPSIYEGEAVFPEKLENGQTRFTIYDLHSGSETERYELPYAWIDQTQLTAGRIFTEVSRDSSDLKLGYIDRKDGKFHELKTPAYSAFAVSEPYAALSVISGESGTVQLFTVEDDELKMLPRLQQMKERLVKPRISGGKLIVNGEGPERAMYIIELP